MGCFNGPTCKQHKLWSSSERLLESLVPGATHMPKALRASLPGGALVKKSIDKHCKKRYQGIPKKLRASQALSYNQLEAK